jgi:hypothetical protein
MNCSALVLAWLLGGAWLIAGVMVWHHWVSDKILTMMHAESSSSL